jgi:ornithine racemase
LSAPRIEIDLAKLQHNASTLVQRAAAQGISITGVTKAVLGHPEIAAALVAAGVASLGDSRIENIERMQAAGLATPMVLVRSPMPSQVERVVESGATSLVTEGSVVSLLAAAARRRGVVHGVVLMIELGDLREGIMANRLGAAVRHVLSLPTIRLRGIGTNLACRSGAAPDATNMAQLSTHAELLERNFGVEIEIVSGGNSANLAWALSGADTGRINNLRLGESILLGCEPLRREPIPGLHPDAITLVAEVIESKRKPTKPWGRIEQAAFGEAGPVVDRGEVWQTILAVGRQDTDPAGLTPPAGVRVLAASSDHLVAETEGRVAPGTEIRFQPDYGSLLRSMTSPFVATALHRALHLHPDRDRQTSGSPR